MKAAFVYNFAKFVEWPSTAFATADAPLALCVLGKGAVSQLLAGLEGKSAHARELRVRTAAGASDLRACHMTFVAASEEARLAEVLKAVRGAGVLTISDADGFADAGGMIGLVMAEGRVQFEINLGAAQQANLKVSAHLAKLARAIKGERR